MYPRSSVKSLSCFVNVRYLRSVAGAIFAGGFFAYPPGFAKPVILFIEAFMVLTIAVTLPMLVTGPPRREKRQ